MKNFQNCFRFDANSYMGTLSLPAFGQCVVTFIAEWMQSPAVDGAHTGGGFIDLLSLVMARGDARTPIIINELTEGQRELIEHEVFLSWKEWSNVEHG